VEDIRRIRNEDDARYHGMTQEEISWDIHERAGVRRRIMERMQREKRTLQGA